MDKVKTKDKKSLLPWIIPLIALIATSWLIFKTINERGVEVIVNFKDGSSLKEGKTFVKYKGFNVGQVTKISISKDLDSIDAHIKLNHDVANLLAREGSVFWIVEPKVSVSEISGLDTIISGSYIEVRAASENYSEIEKLDEKFYFNGKSQKPIDFYTENGINIILQSEDANDVKTGTPIFYKKIMTGKVIGTKLLDNKVNVFVNIYKEYENLINSSTLFYKSGGFKLDASLEGIDLKVDSAASLISGGISFITVDEKAKPSTQSDVFHLYGGEDEIMLGKEVITLKLDDASGISSRTPVIYKGIKIGKVNEIQDDKGNINAVVIIDKKYDKYLTKNTKFFKVGTDVSNLDFDNLDTIVRGAYISLIPKEGERENIFELHNSYKTLESKDMIVVKLTSNNFGNLNIGSDVYYKNIVIGRILGYEFNEDYSKVEVSAGIESKYKKLLNDKTLFFIISSPLLEVENFDMVFNFERFKPFLLGGVSMEYFPSENKNLQKEFILYDSYLDLKEVKKTYIKGLRLKAKIDDDIAIKESMTIRYKNVDIGYIESIKPLANNPYATIFIKNEYKHLIKPNSKFYLQSAVEFDASLSGIEFKMSSLGDVLKGAIELTNDFKAYKKLNDEYDYTIFDSYKSIPFKRVKIAFTHKDAKAIKNGTKIMYKGIEVGRVSGLKLDEKLEKVKINAYIYKEFEELTKSDTLFYLVKPKISLEEISGLETVIKGNYIEVIKGDDHYYAREFSLYDDKPKISKILEGKNFKLYSSKSINISEKAKVYYKKREIGSVEKIYLSDDAKDTIIDIFILDKYKNLVRENSIFYNISGIDVDISLLGADIKVDTIKTVLEGGIGLSTPEDVGEIAFDGYNFILYDDYEKEWREYNPRIKLK